MMRRGAISLSWMRHLARRSRRAVPALALVTAFYGSGGHEVLAAGQLAVHEAERQRAGALLTLGADPSTLPGPAPTLARRLAATLVGELETVALRVARSGAAAAGHVLGWVRESDPLAGLRAGNRARPVAPAERRIALAEGEEAGPARLRTVAEVGLTAGPPAASAASAGEPAEAATLPLRRVERRARTLELGTLASSPASGESSAVAAAPLRARTAASTPAPEIVALAESLGNSPGRIFRHVHDGIAYDPQWGVDAPPLGTLLEGRGTSWEQAWLLQELLIAAGVDARLEWGEVEITPAMLQDLTGVADPLRAGDLLTTGGVAVVLLVHGGQVVGARLPHAWVKAHLDYVPNRGATPGSGDTWIRMDPSLKRYDEDYGTRADAAVPFALGDYLRSGTKSTARAVYEEALLTYAAGQGLGGLADLAALRSVTAEAFPFVPGTLRANILSVAGEADVLPAAVQQQVTVEVLGVDGTTLLSWSGTVPTLWGGRLEVAWPGATPADQATLDLYGGIFATPPYEVELRPLLRLDGLTLASGQPVGAAGDVELRLTLTAPGGPPTFAVWPMFAGEHAVLAIAFGPPPQQVVDAFAQQQATATSPEEIEGWGLARAAATYLRTTALDFEHLATLRWHRLLVLGAAVLAVQRGGVSTDANGSPLTFARGPLSVDVGAMPLALAPAEGPRVSTVPTLELLGAQGSAREGEALAAAFGGEHVTAVGFLTRAAREGQAITFVEAANLEPALGAAELSPDAEANVRFAVERGLVAWIPQRQLEIGGWSTTGYVLENPANGAGAYLVTFERRVPVGETVVVFHSPVELAEVTAPIPVVATVAAENLASWTLATRPTGEETATVIATGTGAVDHAEIGTFDPTLLLNGLHELVLTGTTAAGDTVTGRITVVVEGGMKIGNFTLSFVDLAVPLSGLAIEIVRTYDSRARHLAGDFGQGWTLDVRQGSYRNNRKPGDGWRLYKGFLPCQQAAETKSHATTIRLSDREVYRFRPVLTQLGLLGGGCSAVVGFVFEDGPVPGARLSILGPNQVFWANGSDRLIDLDSLEVFEPRNVRLTTRDGRVFELDLAQGVTRLADPNGNQLAISATGISHNAGESISFTRDGEGRIVAITDPDGESLDYAYSAGGDLLSVTDREGRATQFAYAAGHYLTDIVDARGITPIRNEYGDDGRLLRHVDAFGREIEYDHQIDLRQEVVTDRLGHSRLLGYDERGNVVREVDALGKETTRSFDNDDQLLAETDPLGNITSYAYDAGRNLTSVRDPLGNLTRYTYDNGGRVLTVTDPRGKVTSNRYDTAGNLLETTQPGSGTTTLAYDARGNLLSETDALGEVTELGYDGRGNLVRQEDALGHETTFTHDRHGNRLTETTTRTLPGGGTETLVTTFRYDRDGRQVETVQPGGVSTSTVYDALGQVKETVDPLGRRTTFTYDELGRQVATSFPDGTTESRAYDAEGRVVASTDRGGRVTTYLYDAVGRDVRTTFADATFTGSTYDDAGRLVASTDARGNTTTYDHDAAGRRTRVLDALGGQTDFEYDAAGNQVAVVDARRQRTSFVYDDAGRLVRTDLPDGTHRMVGYDALGRRSAETDQAGRTTSFGYDAAGRLLTVTDALGQVTGYAYDELGNRTAQTDANDHTTGFAYDALGRMVRRVLPDGAAEAMAYDAAGNLTGKTDFLGRTIGIAYDLANRPVTKTYPGGGTVGFTYTATGRRATMVDTRGTTSYAYDVRDRLVELAYPDGRRLTYGWDANGNRGELVAHVGGQALRTGFAHDALNRLQMVEDPLGRSYAHGYDANGNRASLAHPNGVATSYAYDALNRLTELSSETAVGAVVQRYVFTLGPAGNRVRIDEADGTSRSYGYDALYRLTAETVAAAGSTVYAKTFGYDPVGNRLQQVHTDDVGTATTTNYGYDERDRLLSRGAQTWTWDANGNLTAKVSEATYAWDFDDRLQQATLADGTVVTHTYDADGVRVRTEALPPTASATVVDYLVDTSGPLSQVVAESATVGGGVAALSAYYVRGDDLLAVMRPGEGGGWASRFYHADGLGSIRALTDEAGAVTDRWTFTAFGELLAHAGSDPNAYLFAGEMLDPSSGFYYNRARWMDPGVGRFASMDPFAGIAADPVTLHKYLYANVDPANVTDPTGLMGMVDIQAALASLSMIAMRVTVVALQVLARVRLAAFALSTVASMAIPFFVRYGALALNWLRGSGMKGIQLMQRMYRGLPRAVTQAEAMRAPNWASHPGQKLNELFSGARNMLGDIQWHHIVGQQQANLQRFGARAIHSILNLVPTPQSVHTAITTFYNRGHAWLPNGFSTFNQWIARQPWEEQYRIGLQIWREAMLTGRITYHL